MVNNNFLGFFSDYSILDLQNAHIFLLLRDFNWVTRNEYPYRMDENTLKSDNNICKSISRIDRRINVLVDSDVNASVVSIFIWSLNYSGGVWRNLDDS